MIATTHRYLWLLVAMAAVALLTCVRTDENGRPDGNSDVVAVLLKEVSDLKGVVNRQGEEVKDLKIAMEEQQLLLQELRTVVAEQGETVKTLEKQLELREAFKVSKVLKSHPTLQGQDGNDTIQKIRNNHQNGTTTAYRTVETKEEKLHTDKEEEIRSDPDHGSPQAGNPISSGNIVRGSRAAAGVAFSAYLGHNLINMGKGHTIKPDHVLLNDGNGYSPHTGAFTAPLSGVYLFTFTLHDYAGGEIAAVELMVDSVNEVDAIIYPLSAHAVMGSNTAVLRLKAGQAVWLQTFYFDDADLRSDTTQHLVTSSGFLIY